MGVLSFLFASFFSLFTLTYLLQLPHKITGKASIVSEYYETNFNSSIPMDMLFIAAYLSLSLFLSNMLGLHSFVEQILLLSITTTILTSVFCFYFRSTRLNSQNFFSRWFHTVGYSSVIYDVVLLNVVYITYMFMQCKTLKY
jgi:hypothetical protein